MNETTWKIKFQDRDKGTPYIPVEHENDESVYDDILKMQKKLENITRRREYKENYKNIELFKSIYDKIGGNNSDSDEDNDTIEGYSDTESERFGGYEEGFDDGTDDEEGFDDDTDDEEGFDDDTDDEEGFGDGIDSEEGFDDDDDIDHNDNREEGFIEGMKKKKKKKSKSKGKKSKKSKSTKTKSKKTKSSKSTTRSTKKSSSKKGKKQKKTKGSSMKGISNQISNAFLNMSKIISNILFYIPQNIDKSLTGMTTNFANMYSEKNTSPANIKKDATVIKNFIYQIVSFIVAIWVAMNWFFIMIYKQPGLSECGCTEDEKERCYTANDESRFKINFQGLGQLTNVFEFFLEFTIIPLWLFDRYVIGDKYGKKIFDYIPWKIISHFIILWLSFHIVYNYSFFTSIKTVLDGKIRTLSIFCMAAIFGFYGYKIYEFIKEYVESRLNPETLIDKAKQMISPITWMVFKFLYFLIVFVIAMLSINMSGIILVIFVWFMSMYGIGYYMGASKINETFKNMYKYISEDFNNDAEELRELGFVEKLLRLFATLLHNNTYQLGSILLLIGNFISMGVVLKSNRLKTIMMSLIGLSILIVGSTFSSKEFDNTG
jgi:hypothetical protein